MEVGEMTIDQFKEWVSYSALWCPKRVTSTCDTCYLWIKCPIAKEYIARLTPIRPMAKHSTGNIGG